MTESARKNVEGAPIEHVEHLRSEILMCEGGPRRQTRNRSADYSVKRNNIQSESELTRTEALQTQSWSSTKGFGHYQCGRVEFSFFSTQM